MQKVWKENGEVAISYGRCRLRNIVQIGPETKIDRWSCAGEFDRLENTVTQGDQSTRGRWNEDGVRDMDGKELLSLK